MRQIYKSHCLCGGEKSYYNGALGYEAMRCVACGEDWSDHNPDDLAFHNEKYIAGERNNKSMAKIFCAVGTEPKVNAILLQVRGRRLRLHYGNPVTGLDDMCTYDVEGLVSTTASKFPLLVHNRRSMGGALIDSDKIVKITTTRNPKQVLYSHPKYHTKALVLDFLPSYKQERPFMLFCGGDYHSTFESEEMAIRYCNSWWGVKPVIQYQEFCNV